ncbi:MAG: hypothetical protein HQK51_04980 [Oligoflexia bacterium]|nr:hypothetical protein [Oligoflexia bacterium]
MNSSLKNFCSLLKHLFFYFSSCKCNSSSKNSSSRKIALFTLMLSLWASFTLSTPIIAFSSDVLDDHFTLDNNNDSIIFENEDFKNETSTANDLELPNDNSYPLPSPFSPSSPSSPSFPSTLNPTSSFYYFKEVMSKASTFDYLVGHNITTAEAIERRGKGDCWAMSDWLFKKLKKAEFKVRIIQYKTKSSPNHRTVQIYQQGAWFDLPYKEYGIVREFCPPEKKRRIRIIRV